MANMSTASGTIEINKKLMEDKEVWKKVVELFTQQDKHPSYFEYYATIAEDMRDNENYYSFYGYGRWSMFNTLKNTFLWDPISVQLLSENKDTTEEEIKERVQEVVKLLKTVIGNDEFFEVIYTDYERGQEYLVEMTVKAYLPSDETLKNSKGPIPLLLIAEESNDLPFNYDNVCEYEESILRKTPELVEEIVRDFAPEGTEESAIQEVIDEMLEGSADFFDQYDIESYF